MAIAPRLYEIQQVAELTGLTPARLRAWENRYEVVRPDRQSNGYRAYTAEQVAMLRAFAQLVARGERIGDLVAERATVVRRAAEEKSAHPVIGPLVDAVRALDRSRLERGVGEALARRGLAPFARDIVLPLAEVIGEEWALGTLSIAAEHLASEVVVQAMKEALADARAGAPLLVAACLPGERHEWGILATLAQAHALGWRVTYLGADLPVDQVIDAAWRLRPRLTVLTVSDPERCAGALPALRRLLAALPPATVAAVGGAGSVPHRRALARYGLQVGERAFARVARAGARA